MGRHRAVAVSAKRPQILKATGASAFNDGNPVIHIEEAHQTPTGLVGSCAPMAGKAVGSADLTDAVVSLLHQLLGVAGLGSNLPLRHAGVRAERPALARHLHGAVAAERPSGLALGQVVDGNEATFQCSGRPHT